MLWYSLEPLSQSSLSYTYTQNGSAQGTNWRKWSYARVCVMCLSFSNTMGNTIMTVIVRVNATQHTGEKRIENTVESYRVQYRTTSVIYSDVGPSVRPLVSVKIKGSPCLLGCVLYCDEIVRVNKQRIFVLTLFGVDLTLIHLVCFWRTFSPLGITGIDPQSCHQCSKH